ncbi:MAG: hypothetical protein R3B47_11605 [Bacteroidia bacterium]
MITPSCTNLDEEVFSDFTSDNFPQNDEQLTAFLGAAYTSLYGLLNHNAIFSLNEVSSDEILIPQRGSDWFDGGQWLQCTSTPTRLQKNQSITAGTFSSRE